MEKYAEVIVDIPSQAVDRPFHYLIPPALQPNLQPGHRVIVPFGVRKLVGYVMGIADDSPVDEVKPILKILDEEPLLTGEMVDLALWLAKHTYSRLVDVLRCLLPPGIHIKSEKYVEIAQEDAAELIEELKERAPKQEAVLRYLAEAGGEALWDDVLEAVECGGAVINALAEKGYVTIKYRWTSPAVKKKRVQVCRLNVSRGKLQVGEQQGRRQGEVITCLMETDKPCTASAWLPSRTTLGTVRALEEKGLIKRAGRRSIETPMEREFR